MLFSRRSGVGRQETSLDDFRSSLKDKWEVRVGLQEKEKEAAKAAKQREMESKKEVRIVYTAVCLSDGMGAVVRAHVLVWFTSGTTR